MLEKDASVGLIGHEVKQYYKEKRGYWQLKEKTLDHPL